jgi:hypothetical protein
MSSNRAVKLAALVSIVLVAAAYLAVIRWWAAPISAGVLVWFSLNGLWIARRLVGSGSTNAEWLFGPVWGLALSVIGLLILWLAGGRGFWILLVAPWPIWLLLRLPLERVADSLQLPRFTRQDLLAVLLLLTIVPAVAGRPFARVGEATASGGLAYRAYFTADFIWAMTIISEVSKGDLPPKNPFLVGGQLHYYWLSHFLSSVEYRIFAPWGLTIEEVALANSLAYGLIFVVFLYGFVRTFGANVIGASVACALTFLANSFEALDRIAVWWNRNQLWERLMDINVDAVTRWFYQGMPVDGLQRMLLYQPHHLAGYALGLSALLIVARTRDPGRGPIALTAGVGLGLSLLFSSFEAIMMGVAVALVYAARLAFPPQWMAIVRCVILGALPVAAAFLASTALAYVDPNAGRLIVVGRNPTAFVKWPYLMLLSFGPLLILGAAGLLLALASKKRSEVLPIATLAVVALGFYFLTDVPNMQHVWVGWRAGHLLFIALTVLVGVLLTATSGAPRIARVATWCLVFVLAAAALPTVAVDVFNAQDTSNLKPAPGFPWTLTLSRAEVEALRWLKTQTPADAVVQPDVFTRATASWAYMPAFGERRMAAGLPGAMIPYHPYEVATDSMTQSIFGREDPEARARAARALKIDYVYLGPVEQKAHPELAGLLDSRPDLFSVAFRNPEVVIYRVEPAH